MGDDNDDYGVGEGYPLAQLQHALTPERIAQWERIIAGMRSGELAIGSRVPVKGAPAWVTLEVAHGGFATGRYLAAGPLREHEQTKLAHLKVPSSAPARDALNSHYRSVDGLFELRDMLFSGKYRVDVPEEAALLAITWLLSIGQVGRAAAIQQQIKPHFGTLRFYPRPHDVPQSITSTVSLESVSQVTARLRDKRPQPHLARMREALTVWGPLYRRAVALVIETFPEAPAIDVGMPLSNIAADWRDRVQALLDEHRVQREQHTLCRKPDNPKENYCALRSLLAEVIKGDPSAAIEGHRKALRHIVVSYIKAHGLPFDPAREDERALQLAHVTRRAYHEIAAALAERIEAASVSDDEGCETLVDVLAQYTADPLPLGIEQTVMRCLQTTPAELVKWGLIPSADVLAQILPRWVAVSAVAAIENPALRGLYIASYRAFRRRRSLLLRNLQRQVQLTELPWIVALEPWITKDGDTQRTAFSVLREATLLTLRSFPHRITPNPLVKELKALAQSSGRVIPLTEELAADIFEGRFSRSFNAAALVAARRLRGSLYARYYGIDYDAILAADATLNLVDFCGGAPGYSTAANGRTIEQAQIITTHNLVQLVTGLEIESEISADAIQLAARCLTWGIEQETTQTADWRVALHRRRDSAYAFRQMVFFLSMAPADGTAEFLVEYAPRVPGANQERIAALTRAHQGDVVETKDRFLGWSS